MKSGLSVFISFHFPKFFFLSFHFLLFSLHCIITLKSWSFLESFFFAFTVTFNECSHNLFQKLQKLNLNCTVNQEWKNIFFSNKGFNMYGTFQEKKNTIGRIDKITAENIQNHLFRIQSVTDLICINFRQLSLNFKKCHSFLLLSWTLNHGMEEKVGIIRPKNLLLSFRAINLEYLKIFIPD